MRSESYSPGPSIDWSRVRRALLVRLRSIGDTVLMTPCLSALKSYCPHVELTVLSEPSAAPILEDHPLVDQVVIAESTAAARLGLALGLRRMGFDVAFNMHGGTTATFITALSGARHRIGYRDYHYSWMLNARAPAPDKVLAQSKVHSAEQQLALLNWAGVPSPSPLPHLTLSVQEPAKSAIRDRLAAGGIHTRAGFAVVAPAASREAKRWPATGFADAVDHLFDHWRMQTVVIAGDGEEIIAGQVAGSARTVPAVITGLSLRELVALISLSSLFVGNDGGPMHIAAALDRPIVAIFRSSNPDVWRPWTRAPYRIVRLDALGRNPAGEIPIRDVLAAADEVIESALTAPNG